MGLYYIGISLISKHFKNDIIRYIVIICRDRQLLYSLDDDRQLFTKGDPCYAIEFLLLKHFDKCGLIIYH